MSELAGAPIFDQTHERRVELLQKTVAKGATLSELATFLELCGKYDLDPFAKEAWCAISDNNGKRNVLIMIGRDGLRKIAMRQGFVIDGDVVHAKDTFTVSRNPDRTRTITHVYAEKDRGPVLGAWAEVYDAEGKQRGYFYALLTEYRPKSEAKLKYSPWGSQESVMILAAAERTALSMSTPLSGVLAHGELDRAHEVEDLTAGDGPAEIEARVALLPEVETIVKRAEILGHGGLANRKAAAMATNGQPAEAVTAWCARATTELDRMPQSVVDATADEDTEAVSGSVSADPGQAPESTDQGAAAPDAPAAPAEAPESRQAPSPERIAEMRESVTQLLNDADALEADDELEDAAYARYQAEGLMTEIEAAENTDQGKLDL